VAIVVSKPHLESRAKSKVPVANYGPNSTHVANP